MSSDYPSTAVPFENYALADLHDPIVQGPGFGGLEEAADVYTKLAQTLDKAAGDLRAVMTASLSAHEGEAADAGRQHIGRVATAGDVGAAQSKLATLALQEQAGYFARAQLDMRAAVENGGAPDEKARGQAVDAARLYENNSNHNLSNVFQVFSPPAVPAPDISVASTPPGANWGTPGGGATGVHTPGAAAPAPTPAPPPAPAVLTPPRVVPAPPPPPDGPGGSGDPGGQQAVPGPGGAGKSGGQAGVEKPPPAAPRGVPGPSTVQPPDPIPTPPTTAPQNSGGSDRRSSTDTPVPRVPGPSDPADRPLPQLPKLDTPDQNENVWQSDQPWKRSAPPPERIGIPGPGGLGRGVPSGRGTGTIGPEARSVPEPGPGTGRAPTGAWGEPTPSTLGGTRSAASAQQGAPFMPMGGAGGGAQDLAHPRPPWLLDADPEATWIGNLPDHAPAVIEPIEE